MTESEPPEIGGLDIVARLGGGGQADVWWANERDLRRSVAVKVFHEGIEAALVDRERKATGLLSGHDHVVMLHRTGTLDDGRPYLMLEFADAGSLAHYQGDDKRELVQFVIDVARAVAAAHDHGVIHRDIKPENVLLFQRPNGRFRAKLSDFGIAAVPNTSTTTSVRGSMAYAPPELLSLNRKTDERGDVYSLGATLFHALEGTVPAIGSVATEAERRAGHGDLGAVWTVVAKATMNDPDDRYQSAADFRDALIAALATSPATPTAAAATTTPIAAAAAQPTPDATMAARPVPVAAQLVVPRRPLWQVPMSLDSTRNIAGLAGAVGIAALVIFGVLGAGPGLLLVLLGYLAAVLISHALGHD